MLQLFRRAINSRVGVVVTFIVLAVVAVLFGIQGFSLGSLTGPSGDQVAKVGRVAIPAAELRDRLQADIRRYQQQYPQLDMATYIAQGGFDGTFDSLVFGAAIEQFAADQNMAVSDQYVQNFAGNAPAFKGVDGKFNQALFDQFLQAQGMSYAQFSKSVARDALARQLTFPMQLANQVPDKLALPYASSLLEKREGQIGLIPAKAMPAGAAPSDAETAQYYQRNVARYTMPERRVIRYAIVSPDSVKAQATPTDAEIAAVYAAEKDKYAAAEKRSVSQVVVGDQAQAQALAAKVKGGALIADAAKAIGLDAATVKGTDKGAYAAQTSADAANAVFAAAKGATVGPVKAPLGFLVVHIDDVTQVAAKSLAEAKADIAKSLAPQKTIAALRKIHDSLDDAINGKAAFAELVAQQHLEATTTPALTAAGTNPDDATSKPDPKLTPIIAGAFQTDPAEGPQMVPIGQDGSFALVGLDRVVPAAPRPLAQVRDKVLADITAERGEQAARKVAGEVLAAVEKGMPLAEALGATKLSLKPVQTVNVTRAQVMAAREVPPPYRILFNTPQGQARVLEAPDRSAWIIIYVAKVTPGDATGNAQVLQGVRADLARNVGNEYFEQLAKAIRGSVGYSRNDAAIAKLKAELLGQSAPDQQ